MSTYFEDILSQPQELQNFLCYYKTDEMLQRFRALGKLPIKKVIFSGMGSSHYCALTASLLLKRGGIDNEVISAGELYYFQRCTIREGILLCLISQSGESGEIVKLIQELPDNVTVVGITNHPESTLGKRSDYLFPLFVSDEAAVTTRTYLASCGVTLLLAAALQGQCVENKVEELQDIFARMDAYLSTAPELTARWDEFMQPMGSVSVIGRGFSMPSVEAGALFFRETVRFPALDFDGAEFRHGPMEMVDENFYGVVFAPSGAAYEQSIKLAKDIAAKGGHVLMVTDREEESGATENLLPVILPQIPEEYLMFFQILPLQLLANAAAARRGIEAGQFRWGSKITKEG